LMILTALAMSDKQFDHYRLNPAELIGYYLPKISLAVVVWITLYFYEFSEVIYEL
jgi:hypothetical protein